MNNEQLAKGFIHLMFQVPLEDVTTKGRGTVTTSHHSEDGTLWKCKFKFKKGEVVWKSDKGRWRTLKEDIKLSYKEYNGQITLYEKVGGITLNEATFEKSILVEF